ncbi:YdaS antitoxin of YdaST toxin-antitoxin system [Sphingomonas sp. BK235]|nr:YdaS antitoxin of YdaST toxin-antitoxin system [Sphingomonas sp. BK235]
MHLALRSAVKQIGSQAAFERATGAKQQKVSYWLRDGKVLPGEYVLKAEKALQDLGSPITRHDLRPDLYPREEAVSQSADELQAAR